MMKTLDKSDPFLTLQPFFRSLSHEIRNPVQGILTSADALLCTLEENPAADKLLGLIQRECLRINGLLADLLALCEPVSIPEQPQSIENMIRECSRTVPNVLTQIANNLQPIRFDGNALRRSLVALLQNAAESQSPDQSIMLTAENHFPLVRISVKDHGAGIAQEDLARVLEPFFTTRSKKAGLGLTIVERAVRLHDGKLEIESEHGSGTTVSIFLKVQA